MISRWVEQTSVYPPAEIYAGQAQGKQEKQAINLCEQLYKFNFGNERNSLADLRNAWRELMITYSLYHSGERHPMKPEYIDKVFNEFLEAAKTAIDKMDSVFKQHQAVNQYYKQWRMSYQDVKACAFKLKQEIECQS